MKKLKKLLKEEIAIDDINSHINTLLRSYGFKTKVKLNARDIEKYSNKVLKVGFETINIDKLDKLKPVFSRDIEVTIKVGANPEKNQIAVVLEYQWVHSHGSNGYTTQFRFNPVKQIWEQTY